MWPQPVSDTQIESVQRSGPVARSSSHISLSTPASGMREALQQFIHYRYNEAYQADVSHFLPLMLSVTSAQEIQAVVGLRPGSCGQFFVEQYLSEPVETVISKVSQHGSVPHIDRRRVIETGNLASLNGGSQRLFIVLTELLYRAGFDWVCFTATPQVAALLQRLGFAPEVLAPAAPVCLPDGGLSWGRYYDNKPNVLVGDVKKARQTLIRNELATRVLAECAVDLEAAVTVLSPYSQGKDDARG